MLGALCWKLEAIPMLKFELKRLLRGSFVYGLGSVLQRFLSFLLLPLFTRFLQPEDYGAAALVGLLSVGVSGLFSLGTGNSLGILYFKEEDSSKRPVKIWTNVLLLLVYGFFLYATLYVVAPTLSMLMFQTEEYSHLFRIALFGLLCSTASGPLLAYFRMEEEAKTYVVLTLISSLISISASIYLIVVLGLGVTGMLIAGLLANFVIFFLALLLVGRRIPFSVDTKLVKPLVRIGFPSIWGMFAFMIIDYADRQMIQRMLGLDALGIYSVGYNFGMVMLICVNAFSMAWPPFFVSFISRREEAKTVFAKVLKYYLLVFGFLVLIFFGFARPVTTLMAATTYRNAFVVVGMVAAAYTLKGAYLIFLPAFYFEEKLVLQTTMEWIAALTNITLNFLLIPRFGIAGAAAATLGCYMVLPACTAFFSQKFLQVDYEWTKIFGCVAALCTLSFFLFVASSSITSLSTMITLSILTLLMFIILSYFWVLSENERRMVFAKITFTKQGV